MINRRNSVSKSKDWRNLPLSEYNVNTFHAMLIERTTEKFGVDYVPFGKGSVSQRWATEKGQLKNAITTYGNEVVKAWINTEIDAYKPNGDFPFINFGFMYAYRRDGLARIQAEIKRKEKRTRAEEDAPTDEEIADWL